MAYTSGSSRFETLSRTTAGQTNIRAPVLKLSQLHQKQWYFRHCQQTEWGRLAFCLLPFLLVDDLLGRKQSMTLLGDKQWTDQDRNNCVSKMMQSSTRMLASKRFLPSRSSRLTTAKCNNTSKTLRLDLTPGKVRLMLTSTRQYQSSSGCALCGHRHRSNSVYRWQYWHFHVSAKYRKIHGRIRISHWIRISHTGRRNYKSKRAGQKRLQNFVTEKKLKRAYTLKSNALY